MRRRRGKVRGDTITLAHGGGGKAMRDLIEDVFLGAFGNPILDRLEDQAAIPLEAIISDGSRLAFTTDSYVVDPVFFPGGDIGTLAVNGTVNDLAVGGARPLYLSSSFIIEEGFLVSDLRRIAKSMHAAAEIAGVSIVTGDTKVVHRGAADKVFINTAGIGIVEKDMRIQADAAKPGDAIIINGTLGDHGIAILGARGELALDIDIISDCRSLNGMIAGVLDIAPGVHCMRDLTRGGLGMVLNEFALASEVGIRIEEGKIPFHPAVEGTCEILGFDPLYLANEGKLVAIVPADAADDVIAAMRRDEAGEGAVQIGRVVEEPAGMVVMETNLGGERVVDMPAGEQLPRIC